MNNLIRLRSIVRTNNALSGASLCYWTPFQTSFVRHCSAKSTECAKQNQLNRVPSMTDEPSSWYTIYHFPSITFMASLKRLKLYPAALTGVSVPVCLGLAYADICSVSTAQVVGSIGFSSTLTLLAFSYITSNLVGYIYTDDQQRRVKISFLDSRGKRQNRIYSVDDIVPRSEFKRSWLKLYFPIKNYENGEIYKIVYRYGKIYDECAFRKVFGEE
ncbi:transmembrane protein 186 [Toxorhynchites rutilus septentrionalis]|uniref:transmembrane protein 186 n=1 Tax=Toxorhynchites rutilus septentrionalis TaxID=329112 RepID=UPI0024786FAC|nr:transmembrane protein 186 [Toxorhynchites rutilus septentrionalis]